MSQKNICSLIIIGVFILAIFSPFAGAILQEDRTLSYTEKRKLQQLPEFPDKISGVAEYIGDFERYYNDQFGLRKIFLESYGWVKKLLGDHDISSKGRNVGTKNIIEGKQGWFFLNRIWDGDPIADYRNLDLYSEGSLLRATLLFAARAHWLKERGMEYLLFFAPNKHTIYSEYLPDYITKQGEISSLDQLHDSLQRWTSVHFVDLRPPLLVAKETAHQYWRQEKEQATLYFKKDSHWNGAGADVAQFSVAQKLAKIFPGKITPLKRPADDYKMVDFAGDITRIMGRDDKEAHGPVLPGGICTQEKRKDYFKRHHVTHCATGQVNATIFYDSFFPALKPYFTDYFATTVYHWERMTRKKVESALPSHRPDIIIEQRAERHLPFTPVVKDEDYNDFWLTHWPKWQRSVYTFTREQVSSGLESHNIIFTGEQKEAVLLVAENNDPQFYLRNLELTGGKLYLVKARIHSPANTRLQLYFSTIGKRDRFPAESSSVSVSLKKGENSVCIPLFSLNLAGDLRFDPGRVKGEYILRELTVKELEPVSVK